MTERRRGRPPMRVIVSPSERTTLEQWARRRTTAQGLAQRARIVLACAAGRSAPAIMQLIDSHTRMVTGAGAASPSLTTSKWS